MGPGVVLMMVDSAAERGRGDNHGTDGHAGDDYLIAFTLNLEIQARGFEFSVVSAHLTSIDRFSCIGAWAKATSRKVRSVAVLSQYPLKRNVQRAEACEILPGV